MRRIYVDRQCEASDLLQGPDFNLVDNFEPNDPHAVYVVSRWNLMNHRQKIIDWINYGGLVCYYNATEASETMQGQMKICKVEDLANQGKLIIISGGDCDPRWRHVGFEYLLIKLLNHTSPISLNYSTNKPYKFLFLNGRLRHHRKWLLEKMRIENLLDLGLWSCLTTFNPNARGLVLYHNYRDLMKEPEIIKLLPTDYEHPKFRDNREISGDDFKNSLFDNTWGEGLLYFRPYEHTYFSIVTETVFDGNISFRTEKIWKPILAGHPWIAVANAGFYKSLHNLGFKTFGEIIDEKFDIIENNTERLEYVFRVIKNLCNSDLDKFLVATKSICLYNQQRAIELADQQKISLPQRFRALVDG